jgi:mannitol-1-phosphate 5-dehydrogenase
MQQPTHDQPSSRSSDRSTPFDQPTAVHFGAGSIGLGFIGVLLAKAGYGVIFADINSKVINRLNTDMTYTISHLEPRRPKPFHVRNVSGVISSDKEGIMELAEDIADKEMKLVTTSIGFGALEKVAPIIARGIISRKRANGGCLNVMACENGKGATDLLKNAIYHDLDEETQAWANEYVGFANCSVDRIVPRPIHEQEKLLSVGVDKFFGSIVPFISLDSAHLTYFRMGRRY